MLYDYYVLRQGGANRLRAAWLSFKFMLRCWPTSSRWKVQANVCRGCLYLKQGACSLHELPFREARDLCDGDYYTREGQS